MFDIKLIEMGGAPGDMVSYTIVAELNQNAINSLIENLPNLLVKTGLTFEEFVDRLQGEMRDAADMTSDHLMNLMDHVLDPSDMEMP